MDDTFGTTSGESVGCAAHAHSHSTLAAVSIVGDTTIHVGTGQTPHYLLISDLFHSDVPLDYIRRVFDVIADTPQHTYQLLTKRSKRLASVANSLDWPANLWMGVSVESARYTFRIDHLRAVGATVRFISAEPLLGPLDELDLADIHWLIAGGESGSAARSLDSRWVVDLRDRCAAAGVPFFFKQWGGRTPKAGGRSLNGRTYDEMPDRLGALV